MIGLLSKKARSKIVAAAILIFLGILITLFFSSSSFATHDGEEDSKDDPGPDTGDGSICEPIICIDPGHGGTANGSAGCGIGAAGWDDMVQVGKAWKYNSSRPPNEKNFNLGISSRLSGLFTSLTDYDVVMTRNSDYCVSLKRRVQIANARNCTVFLSVHNNAAGSSAGINPRESGTETLYKDSEDGELAGYVQAALVKKIHRRNRGLIFRDKLYVINKQPRRPSIIVEVGFVTNSTEFYNLSNPRFQQLAAVGIFNGTQNYLDANWVADSSCFNSSIDSLAKK